MLHNKIKINIDYVRNALVWYVAVFICLCFDWWLMKWNLRIEYTSIFGTLLKMTGDVALIMLPYWLIAPKWRWTAILPVWLYSIWGVCNLAYFRFWSDLIPPASVTMGGNVDGNLMEYGISLLHWGDLLFLLTPSLALLFYFLIKPSKSTSFTSKTKVLFLLVSLVVGLVGQFSYFKTTFSWRNAISPRSVKEGLHDHFIGGYTGQKQLYTFNGVAYYGCRFITDIFEVLSSSVNLDDKQRQEIASFLENYELSQDENGTILNIDSLNVVYIIVESLNSDMLDKNIGGLEIMPFLDSLSKAEGTVLFDNVVSQTKASSSSDGHLLLMTGLLPPDKIAYSITYGSKNRFPSLAYAIPNHHKYLLLADEGVCWNEGNTLRKFGLGEPLTIKDRPEYSIDVFGRDGAMFKQAIDIAKKAEQPYLMTLMTISMHIPFKEEAWKVPDEIENAGGLSRMEKDYANMCLHTDMYLKEFVRSLPGNTLFIIASDHSQNLTNEKGGDAKALFMAVNTGRTARISRTVGQVNLFPATLDIFGRDAAYGGLAPSAFNPAVDGTIDSYGNVYGNPTPATLDTLQKAYKISDLIIRSDYFAK